MSNDKTKGQPCQAAGSQDSDRQTRSRKSSTAVPQNRLAGVDRLVRHSLDSLSADPRAGSNAGGFRRTLHRVILCRDSASSGLSVLGDFIPGFGHGIAVRQRGVARRGGANHLPARWACGLVGFMVSRGSSMLIEGIEELKTMNRKWENLICVVTGNRRGTDAGFRRFHVERIGGHQPHLDLRRAVADGRGTVPSALDLCAPPAAVLSPILGCFSSALCATIHQTMLVAAMGIEVCIAVALPRLGRDLFFGNSIIYILGVFALITKKLCAPERVKPDVHHHFSCGGTGFAGGLHLAKLSKPRTIATEWKSVLFMGLLWIVGASFYFYEPISGMTCPPMQWGYPRTVEGFFHAISRGQYEKAQSHRRVLPTRCVFIMQLRLLLDGTDHFVSWVCLFIALLPFFFIFKMKNRERSWIIGLAAIYLCVGILLTIIMNTTPDRQAGRRKQGCSSALPTPL